MTSPDDLLIEVVRGTGSPSSYPLARGTELIAMSIGRQGMWYVDAEAVLDVHGFMYFDGEKLFLQSANERAPLVANGQRVPRTWFIVSPPCLIELGEARIVYRLAATRPSVVDDEETMVNMPARPFAPGALATGGGPAERTILDPKMMSQLARRGTSVKPDFSQGTMTGTGMVPLAVESSPTILGVGLPQHMGAMRGMVPPIAPIVSGLPGGPIDVPPPKLPEPKATQSVIAAWKAKLHETWKTSSPPRKIMIALGPVVLASIVVIFRDDTPTERAASTKPAASAVAAASAPTATTPTIPTAPASTAAALPPGSKTLERTAADAVATGDLTRAATLYDQLAATTPSNPAFSTAARILRAKTGQAPPR